MKIAYQGVEGSYSYVACKNLFPKAKLIGYATFEEAIQATQKEITKYTLLPIENSTAGRVANIHTLLPKSELSITKEYFLKISHHLIAQKGAKLANIERVYSHPQALAQCSNFIKKYKLQEIPFGDTAAAIKYIKKLNDGCCAAIASAESARIYKDVQIVAKNINNRKDNMTRFIVLSKKVGTTTPKNAKFITSIFYTTKNIPAVLYKTLGGFATSDINVIKLESFIPMAGNGEASFYLEFEGSPKEQKVRIALNELCYYAKNIKIIGTYAKAPNKKTTICK